MRVITVDRSLLFFHYTNRSFCTWSFCYLYNRPLPKRWRDLAGVLLNWKENSGLLSAMLETHIPIFAFCCNWQENLWKETYLCVCVVKHRLLVNLSDTKNPTRCSKVILKNFYLHKCSVLLPYKFPQNLFTTHHWAFDGSCLCILFSTSEFSTQLYSYQKLETCASRIRFQSPSDPLPESCEPICLSQSEAQNR